MLTYFDLLVCFFFKNVGFVMVILFFGIFKRKRCLNCPCEGVSTIMEKCLNYHGKVFCSGEKKLYEPAT